MKTRCLGQAGHTETEDDQGKNVKFFSADHWRSLPREVRNHSQINPATVFQTLEQQQMQMGYRLRETQCGYYNPPRGLK